MALGTRQKRERQEAFWYGRELPTAPGHPFYTRLNQILDQAGFDQFYERSGASF
jgi:transposase